VARGGLEPPTQGFSGIITHKPSPFHNPLLHIDTYNKHEVVTISWAGSIAKCPECGWKETQPDK